MTTPKNPFSIVWRPNNYRRQMEVKPKDNSAINPLLSAIGIIPTDVRINFNNHTKILSIKDYKPNITIQYANRTLTAIYSQNIIGGVKEHYFIEANSEQDLNTRLDQIKTTITEKLDNALFEFARKTGVISPFSKAIWIRYEDFIKGEEYIDRIPREVIIHDTVMKKVYDKGIEFLKSEKTPEPVVSIKNYIKNRAIENISPEIANELQEVREMVKEGIKLNLSASQAFNSFATGFLPAFSEFHRDIQVHNKAIKELSKGITTLNMKINTLSEKQSKLTNYGG